MQKAFDKIIEGLLPKGETALLAVSGGIDSVCMANLFLNSSVHPHIAIAHCNFHLRGEESDSDEELVREWALRNGLRFHKADFDTEGYASEHSLSIEMAARELRYDWFAGLCVENGYYAVSVAHNANDNAETLMLNLLRGTGLRGISGMRPVSEVAVSQKDLSGVRLIRPLLSFTRAQISEYVSAHSLEYHNDRTNEETVYKRNCIRHRVFPVFDELNPSFLRTFSREMRIFTQENAIAEDYFKSVAARVNADVTGDECLRVNADALRAEIHWEYVLFRLLEPYGFKAGSLDAVIRLVESGGTFSGREFRSQGYRILTSGREIVVKRAAGRIPVHLAGIQRRGIISENDVCIVIEGSSEYMFGGHRINVSVSEAGENAVAQARRLASESVLAADSSALACPFLVRGWRSGDWMRPIGTRGRKKLSDLFTDLKLSIDEKSDALVVVLPALNRSLDDKSPAGEHVAGVCGYASGRFWCRIDEAVKAGPGTSSLVCLSVSII